jgi:hypothetical protein
MRVVKTSRFSVFEGQSSHLQQTAREIFHQIFDEDSCWIAAACSHQEIKLMPTKSITLTYGEIEYESFAEILDCLRARAPELPQTFIDLGSGTGKAIFASALHQKFRLCFGIEILSSLHQLSLRYSQTWKTLSESHHFISSIKFFEGSFFDLSLFDWTARPAVVFANSTCYSLEMIAQLSEMAGLHSSSPVSCSSSHRRADESRILLHLFDSPALSLLWI